MLAIKGSYAPSIFRSRQHGLKRGSDEHRCPWYRLILVQEGAIDISCDGDYGQAVDGDVCLLPPAESTIITRHESIRSIWLGFTVMACQHRPGRGHSPQLPEPQPSPREIWGCDLPIVQDRATAQLVGDVIDIIAATAHISSFDRLAANQRLSYVLETLIRPHRTRKPQSAHLVEQVNAIIVNQLASIHTAADIARRLGISVRKMDEDYRTAVRETPMAFLRRYRLAETARQLLGTQRSLSTIAEQVGYRDSKALYRAWVAKHDVPPRQWRLQHLHD